MAKAKNLLKSPVTTVVLFIVAAVLLLFSTVGYARALPTIFSDAFRTQVSMQDIGVTLVENDQPVSYRNYDWNYVSADYDVDAEQGTDQVRDASGQWNEHTGWLLEHMLDKDPVLHMGQAYPEVIKVQNTGSIDQYVRVNIYKYWLKGPEGVTYSPETASQFTKELSLSPSLIELEWANQGSYWLRDESSSTAEREVFYYNRILRADETSEALTNTLTINPAIAAKAVTTEEKTADGYTVYTTTYTYDGIVFQIEAEVDAIQTHNAQAAIRSSWGKQVVVDEAAGTLRLS